MRKGLSLSSIQLHMEASVASAIAQSRVVSRAAGITSLGRELASVGAVLGDLSGVAHVAIVRDLRRAKVIAKSYADRWARKAEGKTVASAARTASAATAGSVKRIAATESAESFNSGREEAARDSRGTRGPSLLKVWDATLDRRTCPICRDADGDIVGYHEAFPSGTPGGVHPFCRCTWRLLTSEEHGAGSVILPA